MRREHSATRVYRSGLGPVLVCRCGDWESTQGDTMRAQREAHRMHRAEMGEETTGPLKLEQHERIKILRILHTGQPGHLIAVSLDQTPIRGSKCMVCNVPAPCLTLRLIDGDPLAVEEVDVPVDDD